MKKIFKLSSVLAIILLFSACNKQEKEIKETSLNFLNAINMLKYDDARKYATEETITTYLDPLERVLALQSPEIIEGSRKESIKRIYKITSIEIKDQDAVVSFELTDKVNSEIKSPIEFIRLKKVNEKWLVNQPGMFNSNDLEDDVSSMENVEIEEIPAE